MSLGQFVMILIGLLLLYLAITRLSAVLPFAIFWSGAFLTWFGVRSHIESSILLRMAYLLRGHPMQPGELLEEYDYPGGFFLRERGRNQSHVIGVDGTTSTTQSEANTRGYFAPAGAAADTAMKCIYELVCMSGDADTLAMWGLEIGALRSYNECTDVIWCRSHIETGIGSICLVWKYVACALTDLPELPISPTRCDCADLSTMQGSATCESAPTCRTFTCEGEASCNGSGLSTMCNMGPTCAMQSTCDAAIQ